MAQNTSKIVLVLIGVTIAGTLFVPFQTSVNTSTGTQTVTNESVTVDIGNYSDLDGYHVDASSVTVYNSSGATVPSSDYDVKERPGQIRFNSSTYYSDGDTNQVTYDYEATSGSTTIIAGLIPLFVALLILGILASKVQELM